MGRIRLENAEATIALGQKMATQLRSGAILALSGELGAGKTTFVQGLAQGLGLKEPIQSPTFILLNNYEERLFHFDLYRLKNSTDFTSLGFEEYLYKEGICVIEWPERIASLLPPATIHIRLSYEGEGRIAEITS